MKLLSAFCLLLLSTFSLAETINVAAAISLKDSLTKIAGQYKTETGNDVTFTFGSSGTLATQIQSGAPIDLFISAASKQVNDLVNANRCDAQSVKIVAGNSLVLIVPASSTNPPESIAALADTKVTKIAVGEPKSVPAGMYSEQSLKKAGIFDQIKEKLIMGTNVRQVLDYVQRAEVAAGLVYATDAKISGDKVKIVATADPGSHEPIVYPAVVITGSKHITSANHFLSYVTSEKGAKVFKEFGFTEAR